MKLFGIDFGSTPAAASPAPMAAQPRAATSWVPANASNPAELLAMLRGTGSLTMSNPELALKIAAVFRCVTLISGAVATMPLALKRRVGDRREDASDHPLSVLLRRKPNPWQTPSQFRRQLQTHLLLRGEAFAMKIRTGDRIAALIPLMPGRVRVEQLDNWQLEYRYTTRKGRELVLKPADMFHLVGHTIDGVRGLSPIGCARETVGLALAMQRHATNTFRDTGRMTGAFTHPGELTAPAIGRLSDQLQSYRAGGEREGQDLILEEGMTYERMSLTMEDAQFVEGAVANRTEIYMYFGVPPHMAGDTSKTTSWGSGIEQQGLGFVAYTLEDWLTTWEESIARDLIADSEPNLFARFNRASLVRGDIKTRYGAYATARQWGLATINEIRALEEQPPIEGGDELHAPGNANAAAKAGGDDPFAGTGDKTDDHAID